MTLKISIMPGRRGILVERKNVCQGIEFPDPVLDVVGDPAEKWVAIVLEPPASYSGSGNLIVLAEPDWVVSWVRSANPVRNPDNIFVGVEFDRQMECIHAWDWTGYHERLDPFTGKLLSEQFTK